jgi:cold shock CspA family protein
MKEMLGTILKYNESRGFGFIRLASDRRVFFHISNYNGDVVPASGIPVEFDLAPSKKPGKPDMAVRIIPAETAVGSGL